LLNSISLPTCGFLLRQVGFESRPKAGERAKTDSILAVRVIRS
jgi:hypothetical protein